MAQEHTETTTLKGCLFRTFFPVLVVSLLGVFCLIGLLIAVDFGCVGNASEWIPPYYNSTLIESETTALRPFGIGTTRELYASADTVEEIRTWYRREQRNIIANGGGVYVADMEIAVKANPDGDGSLIQRTSTCGL